MQALELDLKPSLMVIDLPPSGGGRSVSRLKKRFDNAPILAILRTQSPVPEQVDTHLHSPYHPQRLVELIETTLMRHSPNMLRAAGMSLDTETRRLQVNGSLLQLRPIGCQILAFLMTRAGTVVPRDKLLEHVWSTNDGHATRALDVHIAYLRRELEADPRHPRLILTERGVGYRLQAPE
jgi:two-component system alkaline phosphatase synthesis response regulator PhoP